MEYSDSHVEFIHNKRDFVDQSQIKYTKKQISPAMIDKISPELLFLACYNNPGKKSDYEDLLQIINSYRRVIKSYGWIMVKSKKDLSKDGIKIILHIENLGSIGCRLSRIKDLYKLGVRSIGLTHNELNQFAGGVNSGEGVSNLGWKAIDIMDQLGIILDLAHLGEKSLKQIVSKDRKHLFISHTGVKGLEENKRNIDDDLLKYIRSSEGYVGVGFAGTFVGNPNSVDRIAEHIDYASRLIGRDYVGIGSDLGGITSELPKGLNNISEVSNILKIINDSGIQSRNLIRYVRSVL